MDATPTLPPKLLALISTEGHCVVSHAAKDVVPLQDEWNKANLNKQQLFEIWKNLNQTQRDNLLFATHHTLGQDTWLEIAKATILKEKLREATRYLVELENGLIEDYWAKERELRTQYQTREKDLTEKYAGLLEYIKKVTQLEDENKQQADKIATLQALLEDTREENRHMQQTYWKARNLVTAIETMRQALDT